MKVHPCLIWLRRWVLHPPDLCGLRVERKSVPEAIALYLAEEGAFADAALKEPDTRSAIKKLLTGAVDTYTGMTGRTAVWWYCH